MNTRRYLLLSFILLFTAGNLPGQEKTLGRLFLTPAERGTLDRHRQLRPGNSASLLEEEDGLTLNGEIHRSDGRSMRWINGEPEWTQAPAATLGLAVGDTAFPASGERQPLLRDGRITIKPAPLPR